MIEASPNAYRVQVDNTFRQVQYAEDDVIGPYWQHKAAPAASYGSEWVVHSLSSSLTPKNFDFVQNTGVFTLSTFVNLGTSTGNYMTIFDTSESSQNKAGFSLFVQSDGSVWLGVTGGNQETKRFYEKSPLPKLAPGQWYHLAVVGSGPGSPVKFYLTAVSANQVAAVNSTSNLTGANGNYATDSAHELVVGGRAGAVTGAAPFNGGLVNQAIFDQALTQQQVQQLFLFGKGLTAVATPWQNSVQPLDVEGDGDIDARDVLVLNNWLLLNPSGTLPEGSNPPPYYDINGSNTITAADALQLINYVLLNPVVPAATSLTATSDYDPIDSKAAEPGVTNPSDAQVAAANDTLEQQSSEPFAVAAALAFSQVAWNADVAEASAVEALAAWEPPADDAPTAKVSSNTVAAALMMPVECRVAGRARAGATAALAALSLAARAADEFFADLS
jgi:hypothetical protein